MRGHERRGPWSTTTTQRGDNLCVAGDQVVLVDWSWAVRGHAELVLVFWLLPSLVAESDIRPEDLVPDAPEWAALLSGYYAARAAQHPTSGSAAVRNRQLR